MVLRFDGNPGIGANLFSEVDNLICLRHLLISTLVVHSNILYIMILKLDGKIVVLICLRYLFISIATDNKHTLYHGT